MEFYPFEFIKFHSGVIKEKLESGLLPSVKEKHWLLEKEIGLLFNTLAEKFEESENI